MRRAAAFQHGCNIVSELQAARFRKPVEPPAGCVRFAQEKLTILADSVLPAPDSPEIRIACRCSSIIMLENACAGQKTAPLRVPALLSPLVFPQLNVGCSPEQRIECAKVGRSLSFEALPALQWRTREATARRGSCPGTAPACGCRTGGETACGGSPAVAALGFFAHG